MPARRDVLDRIGCVTNASAPRSEPRARDPAGRDHQAPTGTVQAVDHIAVHVDSIGVGGAERRQRQRAVARRRCGGHRDMHRNPLSRRSPAKKS